MCSCYNLMHILLHNFCIYKVLSYSWTYLRAVSGESVRIQQMRRRNVFLSLDSPSVCRRCVDSWYQTIVLDNHYFKLFVKRRAVVAPKYELINSYNLLLLLKCKLTLGVPGGQKSHGVPGGSVIPVNKIFVFLCYYKFENAE